MKRSPAAFDMVSAVGLALPGVEAGTKYDGSPMLRVNGVFMAGLAMHPSAEPATLVVRVALEDRAMLMEDEPETYYITNYYRRYPLVLVRLSRVGPEALRDLLSVSWKMTVAKAAVTRRAAHQGEPPGKLARPGRRPRAVRPNPTADKY